MRRCGYLKFGSLRFTPAVPAAPNAGAGCPAHDVGSFVTSVVNAGVAAPVQLSRARPRPVFAYALPSKMYGGSPVYMPTFPRSWNVWLPRTSQLRPSRGENNARVFGT